MFIYNLSFHLQWDPLTNYKSKPVILEGGYEEVIERYPKLTTDPKVEIPRPLIATSSSDARELLLSYNCVGCSCDYTHIDLSLQRKHSTVPVERRVVALTATVARNAKRLLSFGGRIRFYRTDSLCSARPV